MILTVPSEPEEFSPYVVFRERVGHEEVPFTSDGVIINEKLAELLKVKEGDMITLGKEDEENVTAPVVGIVENYTMNYVYMTPDLYAQLYEDPLEYNSVLFHLRRIPRKMKGWSLPPCWTLMTFSL